MFKRHITSSRTAVKAANPQPGLSELHTPVFVATTVRDCYIRPANPLSWGVMPNAKKGERLAGPAGAVVACVVSLVLLGAVTGPAVAEPVRVAVDGTFARITATSATGIEVDVRFADERQLKAARLEFDGTSLPATGIAAYPAAGDTTAVLFLVDTSDPRRADIVAKNAKDVAQLVAGVPTHRQFGLARFDRDVTVVAPLGTAPLDVSAAAANLTADGKVTQLFLSAVKALDVLAGHTATRRALVVFSDGLSEDKGYDRQRVITRALATGTAIFAFGYAGAERNVTALQNLRLMAEETGGRYAEAVGTLDLSAGALDDPLAAVETGARITLSLVAARQPFKARQGIARLILVTDKGEVGVPVQVKVPALPLAEALKQPRYAAPAGGAALILVLLIVWGIRRGRKPVEAPPPPEAEPHARLEFLDSDGRSFDMRTGSIVIGRGDGKEAGNDVVLENDSVSEVHAAIRLQRDGGYVIADLESLNHVFVNGAQVQTGPLADGDVVDLGEVRFRFTVLSDIATASPDAAPDAIPDAIPDAAPDAAPAAGRITIVGDDEGPTS